MDGELNNVSDVSYGTTTRLKVIFIGNIAVGKTSIIKNLLGQKFDDEYEASVGVDFFSLSKKFKGKLIKIQMWDTAGQEKYRSLIPNYVRGAALIFLVYDISDQQSFEDLPNWISFINEYEHTNIALVGNKTDLEAKRKVKKEEGQKFAEENNLDFFEVSAKNDSTNLQNMLYSAIANLPSVQNIASERTTKEEIINDLVVENDENNSSTIKSTTPDKKEQGQGFQREANKVEQTMSSEDRPGGGVNINSKQKTGKKKKCLC